MRKQTVKERPNTRKEATKKVARGHEMTGEHLVEESEVLSQLASTIEMIGLNAGEHQISEEQKDELVFALGQIELAWDRLLTEAGTMQFGPDPDAAYDAKRDEQHMEEIQGGE